jgi:hypothetical protein
MALPLRESGHAVQLMGDWTRLEKTSARQWTKALGAVLDSFSRGMYVNHLREPSDNGIRAAYGPNYGRLAEVKKKAPNECPGFNSNIKPA